MDEKTLNLLEFPKILERLAGHCAFEASAELARALRPTADLFEARRRQSETAEAVRLLVTRGDIDIGGARDVRAPVDLARHGGVLAPNELLDIKYTLISARSLARTFERIAHEFPLLADVAQQLPAAPGLVDAITRAISERGEVLDSASDRLGMIRHDLRIVHDRLLSKLQRMVADPNNAPYLQEALVTTRDGRYVIPLRAEFKGRIRSVVHDQSSSGATLFVEPLSVVEQNNQYRELQLAERDEERRILADLSRQVGLQADTLLHTVEVVATLDLALARGKFAEELTASEPKLQPIGAPAGAPASRNPRATIRLYRARHPLLDPATVVPMDLELDSQTYVMVVTGPNTGGKTVALKTAGLLALMAQAGLHIPAGSGSELSGFGAIYADIGDEQSIEQSLSTFSGHITNIIRILEQADQRSLVILDELGAGTDPQEGSALARAILVHLTERGVTTLVTTHHPELKAFAHATAGVTNASVEFDLQTLRPTYRLTVGLPGRSNALAIAERLGLPQAIIADARSEIHPDELRAEGLLDEIHRQRDLARLARENAEQASREAEMLRRELAARLEKIEAERYNIVELARRQAAEQLQSLEDELAAARKALARARQPVDVLKEVEQHAEQAEKQADRLLEDALDTAGLAAARKLAQPSRRALRPGDKVRLRSLGAQGVLTALGEEEAEVQVGVLRVRARLTDLELPTASGASAPAEPPPEPRRSRESSPAPASPTEERGTTRRTVSAAPSPGLELDLRGKRADEALDDLERYLDAAYLAGLPFVRIIHGKGTGKLREAVRQALAGNSYVKSYEGGGDKEGGEGVTVAKLAVS